jgi:hypothetical protein
MRAYLFVAKVAEDLKADRKSAFLFHKTTTYMIKTNKNSLQ